MPLDTHHICKQHCRRSTPPRGNPDRKIVSMTPSSSPHTTWNDGTWTVGFCLPDLSYKQTSAKSKLNKPEQPPNLDHSYSILVGWILPRLGNATPIAVRNKLSLQSAIAMTGCTTQCLVGLCMSRGFHTNARTQGFPAEHCTVMIWSILFTSPVNVVADRCVTRLPPNNLQPSTFYVCLVTIFTLYHICCSRNQPFTLLFSCRLFFLSSAWHVASLCMVLFGISSFLSTSSALLLFDAFHFCLSSTPRTLWLVLLLLLLLWFLFLSFLASGLSGFLSTSLSCILSLPLYLFYTLSFPSSSLFYMFCRWICGSFFLFALFHFLCRAVVRSAEVLSPQPRGPVLHVEAVDSCLRPPQHPGPMLPTPL